MRIEFFGVRGSFPAAGRCESAYGGGTPCALLTPSAGDPVILDAGTGLRCLGARLAAQPGPIRATLLFTHFHLDHVLGLPFFDPLFLDRADLTFVSWREPEETREILGRLMTEPLFPVRFESTPSKKTFLKIGLDGGTAGGFRIKAVPLNHPQGCLAYRFEDGPTSAVFATDTEHPASGLDERLAGLARGAGLFVYDAMYMPDEYETGHKGWGHSTWEQAVRLAAAAEVGKLLLSHLNPDHTDKEIEHMRKEAKARFRHTDCAAGGMVVEL